MNDQITRDSLQIARLEEQLGEARRQITELREQMHGLEGQLNEVLQALHEARGGWKTLMTLGGAAATLGAGVSWVLSHVRFQ